MYLNLEYDFCFRITTKNAGKVESKTSDSPTPKQHPKEVKKSSENDLDNEIDLEDLSLLLADINSTTDYAILKVDEYKKEQDALKLVGSSLDGDQDNCNDVQSSVKKSEALSAEEIYVSEMAECQFGKFYSLTVKRFCWMINMYRVDNYADIKLSSVCEPMMFCLLLVEFFLYLDTYELVIEKDDGTLHFNVPYHYANMVRLAAKSTDIINTTRARRLAQEVASLSTSLPISFSSTVFLQCDEERLDVMKVLRKFLKFCYYFLFAILQLITSELLITRIVGMTV